MLKQRTLSHYMFMTAFILHIHPEIKNSFNFIGASIKFPAGGFQIPARFMYCGSSVSIWWWCRYYSFPTRQYGCNLPQRDVRTAMCECMHHVELRWRCPEVIREAASGYTVYRIRHIPGVPGLPYTAAASKNT